MGDEGKRKKVEGIRNKVKEIRNKVGLNFKKGFKSILIT